MEINKLKLIYFVFFFIITFFWSCGVNKQFTSNNTGYAAIFSYSEKVKNEKNWQLYSFGGSFDQKIDHFNLKFLIKKHIYTIEEARVLAVQGVNDFLEFIKQDEGVNKYAAQNCLNILNVSFCLSFGDENNIMNENNEIAYVSIIKGRVAYSIDTGKKLERVHQETFEEALKIVESEKQQKNLLVSEPL